MSKLIIQIPCFNEELALPVTLNAIPRNIEGIDKIEILVINDGSTDKTVEVARANGVEHILDFKSNRGLSHVFSAGLIECLRLGADYVVNLDADNQYNADDIPKLLKPLLDDTADYVVGERPIKDIESFSMIKKRLQVMGSFFIRKLSGTNIKDTPSGFRAMNQKAMYNLHIFNQFTYTHESLIAANESNLRVVGVPITVNKTVLRESRLFKSIFQYVFTSGITVLRFYFIYKPYSVFMGISSVTGLLATILLVRFFYYYLIGMGSGWVQSLTIAGVLFTVCLISFAMGVLSDILRINRKLLHKVISEVREIKYK